MDQLMDDTGCRTTNYNGRQRKVEGACHEIPSKLDLMMMMMIMRNVLECRKIVGGLSRRK